MSEINLLSPGRIGNLEVRNRMIMAPMTRNRASFSGVPSEMAIEYYTQRSSAGLIVTEGTAPSGSGIGYVRTPANETPEQVAAWKKIVDAVHARGCPIYLQLMHVGRVGNLANRELQDPLVAPSAIRCPGQIFTDAGMQDFSMPRALETAEIPKVVEEYAAATRNAIAAGFDGVQLHSASGYLPMQFLSDGTNRRTDKYGGSIQNRIRFVLETLNAMIAAAGSASRISIKISPAMQFNDCEDSDPVALYTTLVKEVAPLGLSFLHVLQSPGLPNVFEILRPLFPGTFAGVGGFTRETGNAALASGAADFIVFGKLFIANPDLPERFAKGAPLAAWDATTFYSGGAKGYIDYPTLASTVA